MKPNAFLVALTVILSLSLVQVVGAQSASTSILELNSPSQVMLGQGLTVTVTVKYDRGNYASDFLTVGVSDADAVTFETGEMTGYASSSPDACLYGGNNISFCIIYPASNSGTESVTFHLSLSQVRIMHLRILAAFQASSPPIGQVASGSLSYQTFTVTVTEPSLPVLPPEPITIDRLPPQALNLGYFYLVTNGTHTISAPQTVNVTAGERLRFDHWSDGTTNANETVNLQVDTPYSVVYVRQYKLTLVTSQGVVTGGGWYDNGTTADFSVPSSVPMNGTLGALGGKYDFQGWYENKTLVSSSSNSSLKMNSEHSLTANWTPNYTAPITILLGIAVMAVFGLTYYLIRKRLSSPINR
jgi:uncharacterized repeat protein (TIGR02543 family)